MEYLMRINKRYRKILALLITASMVMSPVGTFGEEVTDVAEVTEVAEDPVSEALSDEIAELSGMTPGEDYIDREGVFTCSSRSEAEAIAAEYNAVLLSFDYGVATVRFREGTKAALQSAELSGVSELIEPNYVYELFDTEDMDPLEDADPLWDAGSSETGELSEDVELSEDGELSQYIGTEGEEISAVLSEGTPDPFADSASSNYQYYHEKIHNKEAFEYSTGKNIRVAVIDSGVNPAHEDLKGKVSLNYIPKYKADKGIDTYGHGTHVCGILAAEKDNGKGGYGVAPGVSIDSIQVTNGKELMLSDVAAAINMAVEMDVDVISMSLGGDNYSAVLEEAINSAYNKGIVCVAAAGNKNSNTRNFPAAFDHCLAVGATTLDDSYASYSNYGDWVNILAPGGEVKTYNSQGKDSIYSTYIYKTGLDKRYYTGNTSEDSYYGMPGTSQATPMVAGVAALCYGVNEDYTKNKSRDTADLISMIICATSDGKEYTDTHDGSGSGVGLVQADMAVLMAKNLSETRSHTLVDAAGHYGTFLTNYLSAKKSFKLKIGDAGGSVGDKSLTKSADWESSDPGKVTVKNGKIKATKSAKDGDRVLITATTGSDTLYCMVKIQSTVKKMGVLRGNYKIKTSEEVARRVGQTLNIESPYNGVSNNSADMAAYFTTKKAELAQNSNEFRAIADSRYMYDISISNKDLSKIEVIDKADNGDPITIVPKVSGSTIKVKYKLLDGSNKKFTLKILVN